MMTKLQLATPKALTEAEMDVAHHYESTHVEITVSSKNVSTLTFKEGVNTDEEFNRALGEIDEIVEVLCIWDGGVMLIVEQQNYIEGIFNIFVAIEALVLRNKA